MKNAFFLFAISTSVSALASTIEERPKTTCHGTEPFWNITMEQESLVFKRSGIGTIAFPIHSRNAYEGSTREYAEVINGTSYPYRRISLSIINEPCSDGMSDYRYQYSAYVNVSGSNFLGCCGTGTMIEESE